MPLAGSAALATSVTWPFSAASGSASSRICAAIAELHLHDLAIGKAGAHHETAVLRAEHEDGRAG